MLTEKIQRYGSLSTHDILKLIALLSMFADHVGAFFYPEETWLRCIGRLAAPIFFFLIGTSRSYRFHADLALAALFMIGLKFAYTYSFADLNILASFLIIRAFFQLTEKYPRLLASSWLIAGPLAMLALPSIPWIQAGTTGWLFALMGYVQKNREGYNPFSRFLLFFVTFYLYLFQYIIQFNLLKDGALLLTLMLGACSTVFWVYRPVILNLPKAVRSFELALVWPARYSLWIYVIHLAILQIITRHFA